MFSTYLLKIKGETTLLQIMHETALIIIKYFLIDVFSPVLNTESILIITTVIYSTIY